MAEPVAPEEHLKQFPVTCFIPDELAALDGKPLPEDLVQLFQVCNGFDLVRHVEKRGLDEVRLVLQESRGLYDEFDIRERLPHILARIQAIYPDEPMETVPLYFLYTGRRPGGKSRHGTAIIMNLGEVISRIRGQGIDRPTALRRIEDICVHEGVHCMLSKLYGDEMWTLLGGIWDDGLAVYVSPETWNRRIDDTEFDFWCDVLQKWSDVADDESRRDFVSKYLDTAMNRHIPQDVLAGLAKELKRGEDPEAVFIDLFSFTGLRYSVGRELWRRKMERCKANGVTVPDLVGKGPGNMVKWLEEEEKIRVEHRDN
jgi:hypothetical protein